MSEQHDEADRLGADVADVVEQSRGLPADGEDDYPES